ncbi:primosomal protein N', partial [uncultured Desulfovibrio sp.]|uniref:replication restart helicase PriA n=1 Tax=uncultured Desulfovibrio sp. TaxID=167968 RepID=UPI002625CEDA
MFAHIALFSPPYATLTYELPSYFPADFWSAGLRVAVPLGRGTLRAGVLLGTEEAAALPAGVACKRLAWPLETAPLLSGELLALARDLASRQGLGMGSVLGHVLPQGLRLTRIRLRELGGETASAGRTWSLHDICAAPEAEQARLAEALLCGRARLLPPGQDAAEEERLRLLTDPPWPVRPSAARQIAILDLLHERGDVSRRQLARALPGSATALRALLAAGLVELVHAADEDREEEALLPPPPAPFALNAAQQAALSDMIGALGAGQPATRLLYGVTGSGKTAVYLELARHCLTHGRSVLLLAPEVALAHKLRRDAAQVLPHMPVYLYHGYQTPRRREELFRALARHEGPCLVVGTRSALFLPLSHLGCVILDEEHDTSFKQDEGLPYQAKEVAWFRVGQCKGLLVLGSATPDIKTFYAVEQGKLAMLRLPQRVGGRPLPPVELVDIGPLSCRPQENGLLGPQSEAALREVVARGEQAVVLLNRRGYAPLMFCQDCKSTLKCPHCQIGLAYHKGREKLVCHYCGFSLPFPSPCPVCKSMNFLPLGEGTEKLAESLTVLAGRPVLRLDRDSTRRPGHMEEILAAFARRESPLLVGTQMLSKGHHFPGVTLVVVADGDLGLNLPDYRAAERTFQLLVQSAGRAGRGEMPGRVLIQTRDAGHYCWQYVQRGDYEGFYAEELARRRKYAYPPFVRLALVRLSYAVDDGRGPERL